MPTDVFALPDMLRDTAFADAWFSAEGDRAAFEIAAHAAAATLEQALREYPVVRVSDIVRRTYTEGNVGWVEVCMIFECVYVADSVQGTIHPHAEWCPVGRAGER